MPPIAYDLAEDEILDALRDGLRENGVELALQPIVTLPQRKLEDDMLQLRATLANLATAPQQDVGEVVNEVKVLQKLIEQLYGARTAAGSKGGAKPPAAPGRSAK